MDFDMAAIDTLSRKIPQLCKVAPSTPLYHMEDVHRAGGVMAILGELARGDLLPGLPNGTVPASAMPWIVGHHADRSRRCSYPLCSGACRHSYSAGFQSGSPLAQPRH